MPDGASQDASTWNTRMGLTGSWVGITSGDVTPPLEGVGLDGKLIDSQRNLLAVGHRESALELYLLLKCGEIRGRLSSDVEAASCTFFPGQFF